MSIRLGGALLRPLVATYPATRWLAPDWAGPAQNAALFGLAPQGVCLAGDVATAAGDAFTSPFHQRPAHAARISNLATQI